MNCLFISWNNDGAHDKIWGIALLGEKTVDTPIGPGTECEYATFWGRRSGKLQIKRWNSTPYETYMTHMQAKQWFERKLLKGYQEIDKEQLDQIYPEFEQDLEKIVFWSALKEEQ